MHNEHTHNSYHVTCFSKKACWKYQLKMAKFETPRFLRKEEDLYEIVAGEQELWLLA